MTQKELENLITYHQNLYYNSKPEIEDWEFDQLWDELVEKYPNSEILKKVGDEGIIDGDKCKHIIHMGSQEKLNSYEDVENWIRLKSICFPVVVEEKLDGISVELVYNNGNLDRAVTRGNGKIGKIITDNVKLMGGVPKNISTKSEFAVRGEIVLPFSNVNKLVNVENVTNVRNMASGIANQKNSTDNLELLYVICYDVNIPFKTEHDKIEFLKNNGFRHVSFIHTANNISELEKAIEVAKKDRDDGRFEYQIDGVVLKQNLIPDNLDDKARPDHQRAYKYPVEKKTTTLYEVEWSRNGYNFTPVAILKPVELCDTIVSRASLSNLGETKRLGIKIPCEVEVAKQNEIIPKIHRVVSYADNYEELQPIKECPICGQPLKITDTSIQCINPLCTTRAEHRIYKWIDTVGAIGFGDSLIQFLVYDCGITSIADLYCNRIISSAIEKTNQKKNLQKAVADLWARSREMNLWDFVSGFDIEAIGSKVVKLIVDAGFNTLESLRQVNYEDLIHINGFGESRINTFIDGMKLIEDEMDAVLNTNRVTIKEIKNKGVSKSMTFCITGALSRPRKEYENMLADLGHKLASSVTKTTDYLVNNDIDSTSSKNVKAKQLNIPIINEDKFLEIING